MTNVMDDSFTTPHTCPVTYPASSEARKMTALAISIGWPARFIGIIWDNAALYSSLTWASMAVSVFVAAAKSGSGLFFSCFYDYCVQYYLKQLKELHGIDPVDEDLMFQIQFNCHGCTNMTREWLEHGSDESPEAVGDRLYEALPSRLKDYFSFDQ